MYRVEITAPLVGVWVEVLSAHTPEVLAPLFRKVLQTFKAEYGRTFPTPADVLEPVAKAEKAATPEAAERAWKRVLDIRRLHYNPDIPGPLTRELAKLPERIRQAARAAGIFREFTESEYESGALHTWGKKRFVESFTAYSDIEQNGFALPEGEIKSLLKDFAETKALPYAVDWEALRERGEEYRASLHSEPCKSVRALPIREPSVVDVEGRRKELARQAEQILTKFAKEAVHA